MRLGSGFLIATAVPESRLSMRGHRTLGIGPSPTGLRARLERPPLNW